MVNTRSGTDTSSDKMVKKKGILKRRRMSGQMFLLQVLMYMASKFVASLLILKRLLAIRNPLPFLGCEERLKGESVTQSGPKSSNIVVMGENSNRTEMTREARNVVSDIVPPITVEVVVRSAKDTALNVYDIVRPILLGNPNIGS
ncbi:unnamed protein product [Citrullus colocynthis]|uniref:Uncharacterized protein n=1 Tax=Citrullus colocynthis TaxID=252529 RepID=A0ABP0YYK4_9ROSI